MRRILLSGECKADIAEAREWYDRQSEALGDRFTSAVEQKLNRNAARPLIYQQIHGSARRASVWGFPYNLYFFVTDRTVRFIACFHTARDPDLWRSRL